MLEFNLIILCNKPQKERMLTMKKIFSIFLMITIIVGSLALPVFAEKTENLVPAKNSTFESGSTDWTALSGGTVSIADNPDGSGKVLKYSDIPEKSYASPCLDIRPYVQGAITKPATVFGSLDVYAKGEEVNCLMRLRTQTENGHSLCKQEGKNYCNIAPRVSIPEGEWTTIYFQFDVTKEDLSSTENWNIAFDGIYSNSTKICPDAFYIDNFTITAEELSDSALQERPKPEDVEGEVNLAQTSANLIDSKDSIFGAGTPAWKTMVGGVLSVVDSPDGADKVLEWSELPEEGWASPVFDIRPTIVKAVTEPVTIYGSIDIYSPDTDLNLLLRIRTSTENGFSLCAKENKNYCVLSKTIAYAGDWTRITFNFTLTESDLKSTEPWNLCFDGITKHFPEFICIDNFYIGLRNPEDFMEKAPIPEKTPVEKNEKTLVGTIRWDCFTKSTAGTNGTSSQVAKILSPKKYHWQAPFFSNVEADDTISFPEYTVDTWEQEAAYAVNGGLSYYAYLWYETNEDMSQPRKMHLKSSKKNTIKMAGILEAIKTQPTMDELFAAMKDSCYLTVSGRPVLFLYNFDEWTGADVLKIRQAAANAGVKNALYIVGMINNTPALEQFKKDLEKDVDAISWYSVSAMATAESYETLATRCEERMRKMSSLCLAYKVDLIPAFTTGRDTRARIETGASWVSGDPNAEKDYDKPYHNWYAYPPTMDELKEHVTNVVSFANTSESCKTNIVCSYGWNEHEEGGWLCPTLLCDENGDLILDKDGKKQANTERLDVIMSVLKALGVDPELPVERTPKPKATPKATPTPSPNNDADDSVSFKLWWIIPVIAVVVGGGAVVTIILIKKKKAETTEE